MRVWFPDMEPELYAAVSEIADILHIELSSDGFLIDTVETEEGLYVKFYSDRAVIGYHKRVEFFRALGLFVEHAADQQNVAEIPRYSDLCVMYDCSRNAVPEVESVKRRIRHLALMGYTSLMLYTEDTYEIEGYPYFGYMRGRYTKEELREMDNYAYRFGMELIPCIQVLAHLGHALRWPAHNAIRDCNDILLVDEPQTYQLIEAMLDTVCDSFRSKRINIGMDEAWALGNGNYFRRHGYREHKDILLSHLQQVMTLVEARGLKPIMWSDMFFSAAFNRKPYYYAASLPDPHMPKEVLNIVPENMEVVYWDYGNPYEVYDTMARLHTEFSNPVWFAGGATNWVGYVPMNQYSISTSRDALRACRNHNIRKMMVTAWHGHECSHMYIFPTLQLFAEDCYENDNSDECVAKRFAVCMDASYEDFLLLDSVNFTPDNPAPGTWARNPSKYLLHQDVLVGLFDKHVDDRYPGHFAEREALLREAAVRNSRWGYLFEVMAELCHVLELKSTVGVQLKQAYDRGDHAAMATIADTVLPQIQERFSTFEAAFRAQWMQDSRIFGWEVMDIHFGALEGRIRTAVRRIHAYLDGVATVLPELEETRLFVDGITDPDRNLNTASGNWEQVVSACYLDTK